MNVKYFATCECCHYKALDKSKWNKHINSEKHKRNGKYKFENYICNDCGHFSIHVKGFKMHHIVCHGTTEEKKSAPFYCECCNRAFFCNLFYNKHMESIKHKLSIKRHELIQNNKFNDIDQLIVNFHYMQYLEDLEKQIKKSSKVNLIQFPTNSIK
jgi:hypothetical protein